MTEAEKEKLAAADRKDGGDAGSSEEVPAWADKLMDAMMKRVDARMDAFEKDRKDASRTDDKDMGEDPTETTQGEKRDSRKDEKGEGEERRPLEAADRKDAAAGRHRACPRTDGSGKDHRQDHP